MDLVQARLAPCKPRPFGLGTDWFETSSTAFLETSPVPLLWNYKLQRESMCHERAGGPVGRSAMPSLASWLAGCCNVESVTSDDAQRR